MVRRTTKVRTDLSTIAHPGLMRVAGDDESDVELLRDSVSVDGDPEDANPLIEEQADGSAIVKEEGDDDRPDPEQEQFDANLAEVDDRDEHTLGGIAVSLLEAVEKDRESRKKRDELYAQGIRATGLSDEDKGAGADFEGASDVMHPVITEGCIDFAARAIKEIFPPAGPCKTQIIGKADDEKLDRAERKKKYMNWQLTHQIREYRGELEQLLSQTPLGGSQYLKIWRSASKKRTVVQFVPIDHVYLPMSCSGLMSAHRVTHHIRLTKQEFDQCIEDGTYRDIEYVLAPAQIEHESAAELASRAVEGVDTTDPYDEDGLRSLYEVQVDWNLEELDPLVKAAYAPYVITVDEPSRRVASIRRNWDDKDDDHAKLSSLVEFQFIPWRGAYALGLPHLIGGLAASATGALRALLDSAFVNNTPSAIRVRGDHVSGQTVNIRFGEITEVEGPVGTTNIRDLIMPLPFNPPSPVLFQLLGFVVDAAKGMVGTSEERIADAGNNMPVGTALALIEQGSLTYSAIHARLHASQARVLEILHRLNAQYLDDEEVIEELGSLQISRQDFEGPVDIVPVSDPNIFSESQRYAQVQAALQLARDAPQLYKIDELHKRALRTMNFPDPDGILSAPPPAERVEEPYLENSVAAQGNAVKAYTAQDHFEHLKVHLQFMTSPLFGANPLVGKLALSPLLMHVTQHLILYYEDHMRAAIGAVRDMNQAVGLKLTEDHAMAAAMQQMARELSAIAPMLQQAEQQAQQFAPQPPQDPTLVVGMAEIQRKTQLDQATLELKKAEQAQETNVQAAALKLEALQTAQAVAAEAQAARDKAAQDAQEAQQARFFAQMELRATQQHETLLQRMRDATAILVEQLRQSGQTDQTLIAETIRASGVEDGGAESTPSTPPE